MTLIVTDAVVLHSIDYLESSRIFRVVTREAGVQSVLARGARTSKKRFSNALGLFAEGQAQIQTKPGRDLHTLLNFDVLKLRPGLAADMGRFTAANALAECVTRIVHEEAVPRVYQGIIDGLDQIAVAPPEQSVTAGLGVMWRLVGDVGFTPSMDECAECHAVIPPEADTMFSHVAGGVLCARCGARAAGGRRLPSSARAAVVGWLEDRVGDAPSLTPGEAKAHQRLLREFLAQHLPDPRALKAYTVWEQGAWSTATP